MMSKRIGVMKGILNRSIPNRDRPVPISADKKRQASYGLMISSSLKGATKENLLVDGITNDSPYTTNNVLA